jgi:hypothetical protein
MTTLSQRRALACRTISAGEPVALFIMQQTVTRTIWYSDVN